MLQYPTYESLELYFCEPNIFSIVLAESQNLCSASGNNRFSPYWSYILFQYPLIWALFVTTRLLRTCFHSSTPWLLVAFSVRKGSSLTWIGEYDGCNTVTSISSISQIVSFAVFSFFFIPHRKQQLLSRVITSGLIVIPSLDVSWIRRWRDSTHFHYYYYLHWYYYFYFLLFHIVILRIPQVT